MSARYGRRSGGRAESALGGDELNVLPRTRSGYRSRRALPLAALALAAGVVALAPTPASPQDAPLPPVSTPSDPAAAREQLEGTRAELASEIDVLSADEAEIRAAVRELEANVRTAEAQRVDADRNVDAGGDGRRHPHDLPTGGTIRPVGAPLVGAQRAMCDGRRAPTRCIASGQG